MLILMSAFASSNPVASTILAGQLCLLWFAFSSHIKPFDGDEDGAVLNAALIIIFIILFVFMKLFSKNILPPQDIIWYRSDTSTERLVAAGSHSWIDKHKNAYIFVFWHLFLLSLLFLFYCVWSKKFLTVAFYFGTDIIQWNPPVKRIMHELCSPNLVFGSADGFIHSWHKITRTTWVF